MSFNLNSFGQGLKNAFAPPRGDDGDQRDKTRPGHYQQSSYSSAQPSHSKRTAFDDGTMRVPYIHPEEGETRYQGPERESQGSNFVEVTKERGFGKEGRLTKGKSHNKRRTSDYPQQSTPREPRDMFEELQGRLHERDEEIIDLKAKCASLNTENGRLNEDIRSLQERSFKSAGGSKWMPLDPVTLAGELEDIRDATWKLAKDYAVSSWEVLQQNPETIPQELRDRLNTVVQFAQDGSAAILELAPISRAAPLCLTALISHITHREIITAPFFFLDDNLDGADIQAAPPAGLQRVSPEHVLIAIYREASSYDLNNSNVWRSDTLRLLNPVSVPQSGTGQGRVSKTNKMIEDVCRKRAERFAQALPPQLLRPMETSMFETFVEQLARIFIDAGQFSVRIWSQRPSLQWMGLPRLAKEPFNISSAILKAHRLYKLDDPNDHSLDGSLTKIMVHPALLTWGTHDADYYNRQRVLAKAVVWLES